MKVRRPHWRKTCLRPGAGGMWKNENLLTRDSLLLIGVNFLLLNPHFGFTIAFFGGIQRWTTLSNFLWNEWTVRKKIYYFSNKDVQLDWSWYSKIMCVRFPKNFIKEKNEIDFFPQSWLNFILFSCWFCELELVSLYTTVVSKLFLEKLFEFYSSSMANPQLFLYTFSDSRRFYCTSFYITVVGGSY